MPEISAHGYERRIAAEFPTLSRGQVKKTAKKVFWMAQNMHEVFDFYTALRILGLSSDTTARDAVIPRAVPTRHISTRLPGEALTA